MLYYTKAALRLHGGGCSSTKVAPVPPLQHDVDTPEYVKRWRSLGGEAFDVLLTGTVGEPGSHDERQSRAVRLVRARYLIDLYHRGGRLQKRYTAGSLMLTGEDRAMLLPEDALIDLDELRQATLLSARGAGSTAQLPILVVSYPWLTKDQCVKRSRSLGSPLPPSCCCLPAKTKEVAGSTLRAVPTRMDSTWRGSVQRSSDGSSAVVVMERTLRVRLASLWSTLPCTELPTIHNSAILRFRSRSVVEQFRIATPKAA